MLKFPEHRPIDLACLGRLAVDLYAQQQGCSLEQVTSFAKYLGGSSANIAFGAARLGLRSAMISRVGNEQMGQFLKDTLSQEGCDISQVQVDPERLTGLALLGLQSKDEFPLLFYRENCADMALDPALISEDFLARCRALLITGTHLSTPAMRVASQTALDYAARHHVLRILDIDYRPVLWGLTSRGEGANRFVASPMISQQLQEMLPSFDLLIGTEDEFRIAGGCEDLLQALRRVRELTPALLVLKLGARGCTCVLGEVPDRLEALPHVEAEPVEVFNVLGAGDAFAAGLLTAFLQGQDWAQAARFANACGAIVVSRHACAPAMPSPAELVQWFTASRPMQAQDWRRLDHLHRSTVARPAWPALNVMAFDHRAQFIELASLAGADEARIPALKNLLVRAVEQVEQSQQLQGRIGVLLDGGPLGEQALNACSGRGWWLGRPVELPGALPLRFEGTRSIASQLLHWPRQQVVKCLLHYDVDDEPSLRREQEARLGELWDATRESGHELLLELLSPQATASDEAVLASVQRLYELGIQPEWWKLAPMQNQGWASLAELVARHDPYCRGAVVLGQNQPLAALTQSFRQATHPFVKGFMVGRSLWAKASLAWLRGEISDEQLIAAVAKNFQTLVQAWQCRHEELAP